MKLMKIKRCEKNVFLCLDDPLSWVHGFVHDGIFEGRVHCGDGNEFHIESTKQYDHLDHREFHSVIYNVDDVIHPKRHVCGGAVADHKSWMNRQTNQTNITTCEFDIWLYGKF